MNITLGHEEILIRFSDLVLIFKVTEELKGSNLSVSGGGTYIFFENKTNIGTKFV